MAIGSTWALPTESKGGSVGYFQLRPMKVTCHYSFLYLYWEVLGNVLWTSMLSGCASSSKSGSMLGCILG